MKYRLQFDPEALREWNSLDKSIRIQLAKKLESRLEDPKIPTARLSGDLQGLYRIKLASIGYRLVYMVRDLELIVLVLSVGRRDKSEVYREAEKRKK
ncbi:MAG: type II toxin-antitoxin system RelE family toxin, partial [Actinomycetota bacterium]